MKYNLLLSSVFVFFLVVLGCNKDEQAEPIEPKPGDYPRQLTQDNLDNRAFLSPDGKYIAFYSCRYTLDWQYPNGALELWLMSNDGFNQLRAVPFKSIYPQTKATFLYWAEDSKSMFVQIDDGYDRAAKSEIWNISVDGKKTKIYAPDLHVEMLRYSSNREKIFYIVYASEYAGPDYPGDFFYVSNADFTDRIQIENPGNFGQPVWVDSKNLIYSMYDRQMENFDLWKCQIDGTGKLRLTETKEWEDYPNCSTDGKYLAYCIGNSVYLTATDEFSPKKIISSAIFPEWIPNKNLLSVETIITDGNTSSRGPSLFINNEGVNIREFPGGSSGFSFSSDGKYFVYTLNGNIWMDYLP
jgi:Tol biopolymer transport system component